MRTILHDHDVHSARDHLLLSPGGSRIVEATWQKEFPNVPALSPLLLDSKVRPANDQRASLVSHQATDMAVHRVSMEDRVRS